VKSQFFLLKVKIENHNRTLSFQFCLPAFFVSSILFWERLTHNHVCTLLLHFFLFLHIQSKNFSFIMLLYTRDVKIWSVCLLVQTKNPWPNNIRFSVPIWWQLRLRVIFPGFSCSWQAIIFFISFFFSLSDSKQVLKSILILWILQYECH